MSDIGGGVSPEELGRWLNDTDVDGGSDENGGTGNEASVAGLDCEGRSMTKNSAENEAVESNDVERRLGTCSSPSNKQDETFLLRPKFCPPIEPDSFEPRQLDFLRNKSDENTLECSASSASSTSSHVITPRNSMSHGISNCSTYNSRNYGSNDCSNYGSGSAKNSMALGSSGNNINFGADGLGSPPGMASRRVSNERRFYRDGSMCGSVASNALDLSERSSTNATNALDRSERSSGIYNDAFSNSKESAAAASYHPSSKRTKYSSPSPFASRDHLLRSESEPYPDNSSMKNIFHDFPNQSIPHRSASDGQEPRSDSFIASSQHLVDRCNQMQDRSVGSNHLQENDPIRNEYRRMMERTAFLPEVEMENMMPRQLSSSLTLWTPDLRDNWNSASGHNRVLDRSDETCSAWKVNNSMMQNMQGGTGGIQDIRMDDGQGARRSLPLSIPRKDNLFTPYSDQSDTRRYSEQYGERFLRSNPDSLNRCPQLSNCMANSQQSQLRIHEWDKAMGLKRSHSKTMYASRRSREALMMVQREYEYGVRMMGMLRQSMAGMSYMMRGSNDMNTTGYGGLESLSSPRPEDRMFQGGSYCEFGIMSPRMSSNMPARQHSNFGDVTQGEDASPVRTRPSNFYEEFKGNFERLPLPGSPEYRKNTYARSA